MTTKTKLRPIGSSKGIIIPSYIVKEANLSEGMEFDISLEDDLVILKPERDLMETFRGFLDSDEFKGSSLE